ncbi:MAG: ROK family glucokinase [Lachnospiraceae bacterium]|nr:ROK family glucokinase [Lachnospiraceae bacterium]
MQKLVAGIDVGGTTIKIGLFPKEGDPVAFFEVETPKWEKSVHLYEVIRDAIDRKFRELGIPSEALAAAAMGLPGPVTEEGYLPRLVNLGMGESYPAKELEALLHVPCRALNDANAAALGEVFYGSAKGYSNAVMVTLGTGVGGGIVVDGHVLSGNRGIGGEIGHFVVDPDETVSCNCGNKGCLEQYASATGIVRTAVRILASTDVPSELRDRKDLTAKDVLDEAKKGDPVGLEALETFGKYLGIALAHLILTTDPDRVILGGGVSKAGKILIDTVDRYVRQYTHIAVRYGEIVLATLGNDAGAYGAAKAAWEAAESE